MTSPNIAANDAKKNDELREFLLVLREALIIIVKYIEKRYWVNK